MHNGSRREEDEMRESSRCRRWGDRRWRGSAPYVHLPGLRLCPQAEIVALCDTNQDLAQQRAARVQAVPHVYGRVSRAAAITGRRRCHHRHAHRSAWADRPGRDRRGEAHLLVEKQLAMDYAEALTMYRATEGTGVRHMTAFTYRFVPAMRYLKHLLGQGEIGLPRHVRVARFQDWPEEDIGWRQHKALAGSGEVGDMGAHRIDYCHDLIGPIARVAGLTRTYVPVRRARDGSPAPTDVEDFAAFIAEFAPGVGVEQGVVAAFEVSKVTKGRGFGGQGLDELEVYGVDGTLIYHLDRPHELRWTSPTGRWRQSRSRASS